MMNLLTDVVAAFQFLTRLQVMRLDYRFDTISRSAKFFPLVGLVLGAMYAGLFRLLAPHLPADVAALGVVLFAILITAGLHEDGMADVADAFGGGWDRQRILDIMKDSRLGSYGALAIVLSVLSRVLLLGHLPATRLFAIVVAAEVLSRWTVLPLGFALPGARKQNGLGATLARQISSLSLVLGTVVAAGLVYWLMRGGAWLPCAAAVVVTLLSGLYYRWRLGGLTGDCFGATIQMTTVAVYLCGVWQ